MPSHQSIFVSSKCDNISYTSFRVVRYSNKPAVNRPRTSKNCNIEVHIDLCKNVGNKTSAQSIDYSSKEREEEKKQINVRWSKVVIRSLHCIDIVDQNMLNLYIALVLSDI